MNVYPRDYVPDKRYKDFVPLTIGISKQDAEWLRELLYNKILKEDEDIEELSVFMIRTELIETLNNTLKNYEKII